ncbi:uncharacterized protein [Channa argus]|uniref:uncharacterized protein isoform X2 n=1 Tax=Channa argus TaxID=215402 RepID=UPI00352147F3
MGRRAADLTTPVPVLGVPALVGVRGWKTTGGDGTGGALLQTWGLHCSVGVQTSPGISRPPTHHSVQLTDTLSTPSDNITQTSNSYITKETEYKEILLLTKSDREKRAILKQRSGESKTKKEVTFKALGGEVSEDVACSQRNSSGTYCYARAIKTNPHFVGNPNNVRPKLKFAARYGNGSVVDSEVIGGISVDNDDAEPATSATFRGRAQTRQQGHYAEQSGKTVLLSAARPFVMPQNICSHCGGRQSVTGASKLGEKSPVADVCPLKSTETSLFTATHYQMPHVDRDKDLKPTQHRIPESITNRTNRTHITVKPQILHLNEETSYRKTPHPACPVHSKGNLVSLSHAQCAGDATSTQPTTILHAKTITVTKATIETRQADANLRSFAKPPQGSKILRPTSLTLSPQLATATKPNKPQLHTYPRLQKTTEHISSQYNMPQYLSEHTTPKNTLSPTTNSYAKVMGTSSTSSAQHDTPHSLHRAQGSTPINTTDSPQVTSECPTSSKATKTSTAQAPTPSASPDPVCKPQQKLFSKVEVNPTAFPTFSKTPRHPATPQPRVVFPPSTLKHNATSGHTKRIAKSVSAVSPLIQPCSYNSEPNLHVTTVRLSTAPSTAKAPDSREKLPSSSALPSSATYSRTVYANVALRNFSASQKKSPATVGSSSDTLTGNQTNVSASSTALLQSAETTQQRLSHNAIDIETQTHDESRVSGVVSNQEHNSKTPPLAFSEPLDVSESHNRAHNLKSTMNLNTESFIDKHKFSDDQIDELVVHESQDHENSNLSQVTNLQNYISLIKSSSSCLQGWKNTEQQRLAHYQGYTETKHKGHCGPCPPVKTAQETDSKTEQLALGISARHANVKLKSNTHKQTHPNYSSSSAMAPTHCISSSPANTSVRVDPITQSTVHQNVHSHVSSVPQPNTGPELPLTARVPFKSEGELCARTGPECNSILPSLTIHLASHPRLRSCEAEAIVRADSKFSPAPPQPCSEDTSLAHSHPADAASLLPPSPQCCKSAALQQRLEIVEASLSANKDRITTLLNIIHDLETCHTPTRGLRCFQTGQDLKNCPTCQKTACIVYRLSGRSSTDSVQHTWNQGYLTLEGHSNDIHTVPKAASFPTT